MKKYRVMGTYICSIYKEVWANSESEAVEKAYDTFGGVEEYINDTIGVEGDGESICADGEPQWSEEFVEVLEDDPDRHECPNCGEELEQYELADGTVYYFCGDCESYFDEDFDEIDEPDEEDDE